mgnify:CR=1 FL=1
MYRKGPTDSARKRAAGVARTVNGGRWVDNSSIEDRRIRNGTMKVDVKAYKGGLK